MISRRDFLKMAGVMAGAAVLPAAALGSDSQPKPRRPRVPPKCL
jgi:hypothetical protein